MRCKLFTGERERIKDILVQSNLNLVLTRKEKQENTDNYKNQAVNFWF